jgi:hypothetical protein
MRFPRIFSTHCRTNSQSNDLEPAGSRTVQVVASMAAGGLVIASCGFGALFAWQTGLHHGTAMAALFVLFGSASNCASPWQSMPCSARSERGASSAAWPWASWPPWPWRTR